MKFIERYALAAILLSSCLITFVCWYLAIKFHGVPLLISIYCLIFLFIKSEVDRSDREEKKKHTK